ncbi:MAG: ATP-binding cassette domain-containing protein [Neisseriaceae bacterium]|nr:ATP-binding cassette domain-containing protein [Neisseriaceae bacterium]
MIEIKNLSLQRGTKVLLDQASLTINPNTRWGLIGQNGTGKSSLFALLKGELVPDKGDILMPKNWRIASVAQETPALEISALEYALNGDAVLQSLQAELKAAEAADDGERIALVHQQLDDIDAYTAPSRAAKLLSGLGFDQDEHNKPTKAFSGGWRMRLNLAQALMCRADLLLLDEPTNHLDLETVLWLEEHLTTLACTQIIISHDRDFLNTTTTHIAELAQQKLTAYTGNYDAFEQARALKLSQQQSAYEKQQGHIAHLQSFITRFKAKATKAKQAQSRVKALERLELIAPAHLDSQFNFEFISPDHLPNPLLKIDHADLGYGDQPIFKDLTFSLESGARYGLLGVNGSGKSTLIKTIAGTLAPLSGSVIKSEKLNVGYFAQHQLDTLRPDQSPIWHIQSLSPEAKEQDIRNFLGGFNFVGDMAMQAIEPFSGGEKARLALAMIVWQKPNLLLLDEPTNHLDLNLRHALTFALQSFSGALILVSHDRSLLEATTDSFLLVQDGKLTPFDGDLNAYRLWRLEQFSSKVPAASGDQVSRKDVKRKEAQLRQALSSQTKPYVSKIAKAEKDMDALGVQQAELEAFLASEDAYAPEQKDRLQKNLAELAQIKSRLTEIEADWLMWQETVEQIKADLAAQLD